LNDPDIASRYDSELAATPLFERDLRFAQQLFRPLGSVIDLGCGTGRLVLSFARAGYPVLGVDLSAEILRVTHQKAMAAGVDLPLLRANLVELDVLRDASFDYAACLFSTLGMVTGGENRRKVLAHVHRILRPGGRFLLHAHNYWFHLATRAGRRWLVADWSRRLRGAEAGDFEMPPHNGIRGLALHHFSRGEIVRELKTAGFQHIRVEPISLRPDCRLPLPWLFPGLRAYGFLVATVRPRS
jgi:ubiquinone/menaquinone biosynthesis C-methylase UbiE